MVILGHCIFPFIQLIDYFHMPLLFLLAGLTYSTKSNHDFILSKINRIFVPYVFFAIISAIISYIPHELGGPFNGPLWFLQNIFVALIIVHISTLSSVGFKYGFMMIIFIASYLLAMDKPARAVLPFQLPLGCLSALFILIGFSFKTLILKDLRKSISAVIFAFSAILFLALAFYAKKTGLEGGYVSFELFQSNYVLALVLAIVGSVSVIYVSKVIGKSRMLEYLGRNTLCIMSVHFPLAMLLDGTLVKLPFLPPHPIYSLWPLASGASFCSSAWLCAICARSIFHDSRDIKL